MSPPLIATEEAELRAWLRMFSTDRPRWGWRRAGKMARKAGWNVDNKRILKTQSDWTSDRVPLRPPRAG